jgi:hypothetical protein
MTKKEVAEIIAANVGKPLYLRYCTFGNSVEIHEPVSKTKALKNAKFIHSVRVSTYNEERPDLKGRISNGEQMVVTFDATTAGGA